MYPIMSLISNSMRRSRIYFKPIIEGAFSLIWYTLSTILNTQRRSLIKYLPLNINNLHPSNEKNSNLVYKIFETSNFFNRNSFLFDCQILNLEWGCQKLS
ncbi:hypothetical protein BpHYR1_033769 [Brachionus plicatilis]|uniref:Uncharacterized protein n=1 Tax=Brachionus plicatilis TaxID=10195 RepID=A0A3M7PSR4_BRAPC|nr:hypothetical protein BpHYR1_033769 [Brachionus plicatilis]